MNNENKPSPALLSNAIRTEQNLRMSTEGKFKCAKCHKIEDGTKGLLLMVGGNVLLGFCYECIAPPAFPLVIERVERGIHAFSPGALKPQSIIVSPGQGIPGIQKNLSKVYNKIKMGSRE
jgi:hypothetical protein